MSRSEIVLSNPVRTPIGAFNGSLKDSPATQLGALVIAETLRRSGLRNGEIAHAGRARPAGSVVETVIMGNVVQAGNRMNPARQAAIHGGLPVEVPAMTVNRVCGSGAQAIVTAAQEIAVGDISLAVAGGMENMDRAPYLLTKGRWGYRMGPAEILDSVLTDGLQDAFSSEHSGWHTEDLVTRSGLTREEQDAFAARSQQRIAAAREAGHLDAEIVPVEIEGRQGTTALTRDEAPRPDTTAELLARLKPAFRSDGTITAGNAPGLNSGASAMVVSSRARADELGIEPMGWLVSWGIAAVEPGLFGLGPVPAIEKALDRAAWSLGDVERFEINEAFAAVPLAVAKELGIPLDLVNVEGGAIAHGHPIGATGAVLTTRLLHAMKRDGIRRGIVSLCIGGGQGIALALERI